MRNLFCDSDDLHNEADVKALFVEPLLRTLGYEPNRIRRETAIEELPIPRGSQTEGYRPDYVLMDSVGRPVVVADAKHPGEDPGSFRYQVSGYSLLINQRYPDNPIRYCMVTNGLVTELLEWDREAPVLSLRFGDFEPGDAKFAELRSAVAYEVFNQKEAIREFRPQFRRPTIREIVTAFETAHNTIWKKEKYAPTKAFYELAKVLFVKLRQDRRVHDRIAETHPLSMADFYFTVDWINQQPTPNPVSSLFQDIQKQLEDEIRTQGKKRIFGSDEQISLRPSTIIEVVRILESFDLHGIDEDLNGRMFETFLNATVRGRDLGQYFTPRPVVKYMTKSARLRVTDNTLPKVIDACCGSGGFLIEALAEMEYAIRASGNLTNVQQDALRSTLETDTLYGIEANEEIGRVARLNMYLHGDGGSRIYVADALDKELAVEAGLPVEERQQMQELQSRIVGDGVRFDVALTNPPFSMSYRKDDPAELGILRQYEVARGQSTNSNVLFLERYRDLLNERGELLTVIDDTVLNGPSRQDVRDFIREHFVIRQVVSLPFNTFLKAQAGGKTSILHLRRKRAGEQQGSVFMAVANNVGHDDHRRDTPHRDNLPEVANLFIEWDERGRVPDVFRANEADEPLGCPLQVFVTPSADLVEHRLDAFYYAPDLRRLWARLDRLEEEGEITLRNGAEFELVPQLSAQDKETLRGTLADYIQITDVTRDGSITSASRMLFEELPSRASLRMEAGDVLFAKNISSRGTAVLAPEWLDGGFTTSGFIGIRPETEDDALILWSIFRSEMWRRQIYYLSITATQPEVRDHIFNEEMRIPWPATDERRERIIGSARELLQARNAEREASRTNLGSLDEGAWLAG